MQLYTESYMNAPDLYTGLTNGPRVRKRDEFFCLFRGTREASYLTKQRPSRSIRSENTSLRCLLSL